MTGTAGCGARSWSGSYSPRQSDDPQRGDHRPRLHRADGRLAVVVKELDQLVDDFSFVFLAGPGVTSPLFGQHYLSCFFDSFGCA